MNTHLLFLAVTILVPFAVRGQEVVVTAADKASVSLSGSAKLETKGDTPRLVMGTFGRKGNDGDGKITVTPNLPAAGDYAVYLRWQTVKLLGGQTKQVPSTISFAGGERTLSLNQQAGNEWIFVGVYPFAAGKAGSVTLSEKGTVGAINLEGARFVPEKIDRSPRPKHLPEGKGEADVFDKLRVKFADLVTTPSDANLEDLDVDNKLLAQDLLAHWAWQTMARDPAAGQLFPDIRAIKNRESNNDSWQNLQRLQAMAKAYVCSSPRYGFGQRMQGNPKLLADILAGLEWVNKYAYNDQCVNKAGVVWYANEIGSPRSLTETMLCVYPALSDDQKARYVAAMHHMSASPRKFYINAANSAGMNRVNLVNHHILRAILQKDDERMKLAIDTLDEALTIRSRAAPEPSAPQGGKGKAKGGKKADGEGGAKGDGADEDGGGRAGKKSNDGFYADGTFIQHGYILYNGGYGINLLRSFAGILELLRGTPYEIKNPKIGNLPRWVYDGLEPLMAYGDEFPRTIGRAWGMKRAQNYVPGYGITETVTTLIPAVPPADAANFKAMVKGWMQQDPYGNLFTFDNYRLSLQTVALLKGIAADPSIKPRPRPVQSHVYYAGDFVAHHREKWAAALSMSSTRIATHECIWATNKRGWYQGDGMLMIYAADPKKYNEDYRALVNPYRMPGTTVDTQPRQDGEDAGGNSGKLSTSPWAGGVELGRRYSVASMELHAQEATLRARKAWFFLDREIVCLGAGITSSDDRPIETVLENTKPPAEATFARGERWAHLGDTGWYFPQPVDYRTNRCDRTGSWHDVYAKEDPVPVTRNFFEMWIDHGKAPKDAGYAYVVLPGATADEAKAYGEKPGVEVLANTAKVQAVRAGNLLGINFWEAGEVAGVSSSAPAAVLIEEAADKTTVAVADPTQLNAGPIEISIPGRRVKWSVPTKGAEGRSFEKGFPR